MRLTRKTFKFFALCLIVLLLIPSGTRLKAASHREAPLIALDPTADNTDVYSFRSPEDPSKVVILANWIPLEPPAGGPNFYNFDPSVTYDIHIVNDFRDGDATEDITFRFKFRNEILNPLTFLYNTDILEQNIDPERNIRQLYSITGILGPTDNPRAQAILADGLYVAPSHVGNTSVPNPGAPILSTSIYTVPLPSQVGGGSFRVFVGQRDEGFYADLGAIFDLLQLRTVTGTNAGQGVDALAGFNVHTIALELPIGLLTRDRVVPTDPNDPRATIGVYSSTQRSSKVTLPGSGLPPTGTGDLQQISRLANPLVNEVIIPVGFKDLWNQSSPNFDNFFVGFFQNNELSIRLLQLFGVNIPPFPRDDLVEVFLTGIPGLNFTGNTPVADLLRLNVALPAVGCNASGFNRLGVIGGDNGGYPNGRRVCDDVVDIALRVVAGVRVPGFNVPPNNTLGDGIDGNDKPFLTTFPYLASPHSGSDQKGINKVSEDPAVVSKVVSASGGGIPAALAEYRSLLGDPNNGGAAGEQPAGRREINWDAVPAAQTNTDTFPGNFFNVNSTRGNVYTTPGIGLRVSDNDFSDINPNYGAQFNAFSPPRTFAPIGSNILNVHFQVAGATTPAAVTGFGVIFSDVDTAGSTYLEFFKGATSLGVYNVPVRSDANGHSFLGVVFNLPVVTSVRLVSGQGALGPSVNDVSDGGPLDLVVMDDFFYGEPKRVVPVLGP